MRTPSAAPPSVFEFHDEGSDVLAECEDFVLTETFTLDGRATTFFNKQGDPVRVTIHADFVGVIANSASGNTFRDSSHQQITQDLITGEETTVGLIFNLVVPGLGPVAHDTGKIVVDANRNVTFVGGPTPYPLEPPRIPALCCCKWTFRNRRVRNVRPAFG